jgi:hypothetical protein
MNRLAKIFVPGSSVEKTAFLCAKIIGPSAAWGRLNNIGLEPETIHENSKEQPMQELGTRIHV